MTGYDFHPEAAVDLDEIWEFIAADNLEAADGVIGDILRAIDVLVTFPHQGYRRSDLTSASYVSRKRGLSHSLRAG
jgi:plasmid stabilization system protein ParE